MGAWRKGWRISWTSSRRTTIALFGIFTARRTYITHDSSPKWKNITLLISSWISQASISSPKWSSTTSPKSKARWPPNNAKIMDPLSSTPISKAAIYCTSTRTMTKEIQYKHTISSFRTTSTQGDIINGFTLKLQIQRKIKKLKLT